ncbi:MAG: porin family protein [Phycisphaeraceae bacterium]|nr:porin family protein [Phycisphaeraceae bacterium]
MGRRTKQAGALLCGVCAGSLALGDEPVRFEYAPPAPLAASAAGSGQALSDSDWNRRQREIAQQEMWMYYRVGVGATDRGSANFDLLDGVASELDFDEPGFLLSFAIGGRYRIWDDGPFSRVGFRVEIEGLFSYDSYDRSLRGGGAQVGDGDLFEYGFSLNFLPDVHLGPVSLFAGGGIGASVFRLSDSSPTDLDSSRGALALQAMAGASVRLAEPVSLYAMVRYRTFSNIHYRDNGQRIRLLDLDAATLEVGLEFRF